MTLDIQPRTRTIFIWVALIPVSLACVTYWTRIQFNQTVARVSHTQQVLHSIDELIESTTNAETGQRGFLLTGQPEYAAPFEMARRDAPAKVAALRELLRDNPAQIRNLDRLQQCINEKLDELQRTVDLNKQGKTGEALAIVRSNRGLQLMQQIIRLSEMMTSEENQRLQQRLAASEWSERAVDLSSVSFIAATLVLLFWAWRLIDENARERDAAELSVRELNQSLERRVAERTRELQEANVRLSRSNADLERFAYVASHDLQEPLRMVASYVGLIRRRYEGRLDAAADEYISFAVDGAKRMQSLIQDLLTYAGAGTQALTLETVDLTMVLQDALRDLQAGLLESGAAVVFDQLPLLPVDALKMAQVFQNLIGNAIKFAKPQEPPRIEIHANQIGDKWEIAIRDHGIGFDPQFSDRIFVLFQRLHGAAQYAGTGIGLAICKRIVEAHGGTITAESTPGQGSVFRFTLPAGNEPAIADSTSMSSSVSGSRPASLPRIHRRE